MVRNKLTAKQKQDADKQRQKQLDELGDKLARAVRTMQAPEGWKAWLDVANRLPNYSLNNQLLLLIQAAERGVAPRAFASFNRWKQIGYPVGKGECAYRIYGPVLASKPHDKDTGVRITEEDAKGRPKDAVQWKKIPVAFKPVPTFGIEQTTAKNLGTIPEELKPALLKGCAPEELVSKLESLVQSEGAKLAIEMRKALGEANGYYRFTPKTQEKLIVVADDLDDAAYAKTLLHEISHMILHTDSEKPRALKEIEAESTAYLVAGIYGLDTSTYTFPYIAGWSGWDEATVQSTADTVRSAATTILHKLEQSEIDDAVNAHILIDTAAKIQELKVRASTGPEDLTLKSRHNNSSTTDGFVEDIHDFQKGQMILKNLGIPPQCEVEGMQHINCEMEVPSVTVVGDELAEMDAECE